MAARCLALDFGGTLASHSPAPSLESVLSKWRESHSIDDTAQFAEALTFAFDTAKTQYARMGKPVSWQSMLTDACIATRSSYLDVDSFVDQLWHDTSDGQVDEYTARAIGSLWQAGYTMLLACNTRRPAADRRRTLERAGILKYFSATIISSELGFGKPDGRFYAAVLKAGRQHGHAPHEILFVGDSLDRDVLEPRAHGMLSIWVNKAPANVPSRVSTIPDVSCLLRQLGT